MPIDDGDVQRLVAYCTENLGDKDLWAAPKGYPDSLALCVIDSIYSTGSHYTSVGNVIDRYRQKHGSTDGAKGLISSIEAAGGARQWASDVAQNKKPANTRENAKLKAEVIEEAARLLTGLGVDSVPELVARVADSPEANDVHDGWKRLPSQGSGITYNYLLILAGMQSVKPDRMVVRFLNEALGAGADLSVSGAVDLVTRAATEMEVNPRDLDHVIWRYASGRQLPES